MPFSTPIDITYAKMQKNTIATAIEIIILTKISPKATLSGLPDENKLFFVASVAI